MIAAHGPEASVTSARAVTAIVRRAHVWRAASRALESVLLGGAAAALVATAAILSGERAFAAWPVAAVAGVLAALTWWLEQRAGLVDTVRALDRRLDCAGALTTAFELEGRARALAPMETLVQARALARLARPVGRLFPPQPLASAVLLGAAFAWILARDVERAPGVEDGGAIDLAPLSAGLADALEPALAEHADAHASTATREAAQSVRAEIAREGAELERSLARGDRAAARRAVDAIDGQLASIESRAREDGSSGRHLREARAWADALRAALATESAESGGSPDALTPGVADGTMSGSSGTPDASSMVSVAPPLPPLDAPRAPVPTAPDVRAWPREYRDVVTRWIELRRAALEGEG